MDQLRVRVYNVRFGDAILVSVPDRGPDAITTMRHILIDVGNSLSTQGGADAVFAPVIADILKELDGKGLDLYVMTHEHMDHVQGLLYADKNTLSGGHLHDQLKTQYAWLTASSEKGYYDKFTKAGEKHEKAKKLVSTIQEYFAATDKSVGEPFQDLMAINNPRATDDCVDFLKELAEHPYYVYRGVDLQGKHNFQEAKFEIWAPEQDTSIYYGDFQPVTLGVAENADNPQKPALIIPEPPEGVDCSAFYNLVAMRRNGWFDNLLAIDKANNNTSVVFSLEWRQWRLLFTGDAEVRSWQEMNKNGVLKPVHFLKVAHHGSLTGTPPSDILESILPDPHQSSSKWKAAVSTYPGKPYPTVPDPPTLEEIKQHWTLMDTEGLPDGDPLDFVFEG
jgi:hypothetical protein